MFLQLEILMQVIDTYYAYGIRGLVILGSGNLFFTENPITLNKKKNYFVNSMYNSQNLPILINHEKLIYLSSASPLDDYIYYKLVSSYKNNFSSYTQSLSDYEYYWTNFAMKWNFFCEEVITTLESDFETRSVGIDYSYEHSIPYLKDGWKLLFEILCQKLTKWNLSIHHIRLLFELILSFRFEPFFPFREKTIRNERYFRYSIQFSERNFIMEDSVFREAKSKISKDLDLIANNQESDRGMWIFYNFFTLNLKQKPFFLENFDDYQNFSFDKNFFYLWNYWDAFTNLNNLFTRSWMIWKFYFTKNRLLTPMIQYPSVYTNVKSPFAKKWSREKLLSVFPELALQSGNNNTFLDFFTAGYNRFFHAGETYMDAVSLLRNQWLKAANYNYGEYNNLIADFGQYQAVYLTSNMGSLIFAAYHLLYKKYEDAEVFQTFINDFDDIFRFYDLPEYEENFWGKKLFPLTYEERLKFIRDPVPGDDGFQSRERMLNLFFGYNFSCWDHHVPSWAVDLFSSVEFYMQIDFDATEDRWRELTDDLANKKMSQYTHIKADRSLFIREEFKKIYLSNLISYVNEKIHNESGFLENLFKRAHLEYKKTQFLLIDFIDLFYNDLIPTKNYYWGSFYSLEHRTFWEPFNLSIKYGYIIKYFSKFYNDLYIKMLPRKIFTAVVSANKIWFGSPWPYDVALMFELEFLSFAEKLTFLKSFFSYITPKSSAPDILRKYYIFFLNFIPQVILKEFFTWVFPVIQLEYVLGVNNSCKIISVKKIEAKASIIPLEFFLFYSWNNSLNLQINTLYVYNNFINNNFINNNFFLNYSSEEFETFIKLWGLTNYYIKDDFDINENALLILNILGVEKTKLGQIELQRYIDYVVKKKTYHSLCLR